MPEAIALDEDGLVTLSLKIDGVELPPFTFDAFSLLQQFERLDDDHQGDEIGRWAAILELLRGLPGAPPLMSVWLAKKVYTSVLRYCRGKQESFFLPAELRPSTASIPGEVEPYPAGSTA